jgi:hypothetical protein
MGKHKALVPVSVVCLLLLISVLFGGREAPAPKHKKQKLDAAQARNDFFNGKGVRFAIRPRDLVIIHQVKVMTRTS